MMRHAARRNESRTGQRELLRLVREVARNMFEASLFEHLHKATRYLAVLKDRVRASVKKRGIDERMKRNAEGQ